ncbi:hypothetical protein [Pseudomonas sp. BP01]|uniref:hypothetical protein n=1 Tax=Pseudomonas sp. BP01 TaxID=2976152 RepID=UPI001FAAFBC7|nr:hypothetical protein [Pseudomonas sp. BP01]
MVTNKKKISDLPVWGGDKEMRLHAHKPGMSQAVSIAEIVAAVPVPEAQEGGALPTGAVVMMPVGAYEDYLECNGAVIADASAPELAQVLKTDGHGQKYAGYIADSEVRSTVGTSVEISHAVRHKGYTFYKTPTAGNLIVAVDSTGNVVFTGTTAASGDLYATENAVYFVSSNSLYSITVVDGVFKSQYTGESASSFGGVATVSETEDLYIQATGVARLFNPVAKTSRAVSYANGASLSGIYTGLIGCAGGRIFAASTINTVPGLYEFKYDQVTGLLSADLVMHASPAFNVLVASVNSSGVYFGVNGIQYRLDVASGNVNRLHAPVFASYSASVFKAYALDDFVFFTMNSGGNLAYMSFDGGRNWVGAPGFNAKLSLAFVDESTGELVVAGSAGSQGSVNGSTGNIQRNLLKLLAVDQFILPKINTTADGYRYYVKK